jgi:ParB-like chromosome segregation protein Spo0J
MTAKQVEVAFESDLAVLPLAALLPVKQVTDIMKQSVKYRCIARSVEEIGVIEPIVVYRKPDHLGRHLLLDGHLKRAVLLDRGDTEAECLLAKDDEAFTYNKRISRLAIVQEHFMILRAIERGVPEEKIAKALDVNVEHIRRRRRLLRGVCPEVVDLLRDKSVNPVTFDLLRKMKPVRQIESCKLMVSASNYASSYAKALLAATNDTDRVRPVRQTRPTAITSADLALMERELKTVRRELQAVETCYGSDMLDLVIATRYVSKLVSNRRVVRYMEDNHPEILGEFRAILSATSLDAWTQVPA